MIKKATERGWVFLVWLSIAFGADVNAVDEDSETLLIKAARKGHKKVVKLLLKKGAAIDTETNGDTALMRAAFHPKFP